ncbi:PD40 domain-containing protein [Streptomyces rimosus]|uniref:TolB family protein n=1 Tax=Streptomyces rimosus TaxID=1927 RepID=UPI0004C5B8BC|nr:PD40 domain-containing protein [Streptomyces rimosus]
MAAALSAGFATALPPTTAAADARQPRTEQVSVAQDGTPADAAVDNGRISGDGRYVVFTSRATNLVPGAAGDRVKVFLKDLRTGRVELISATPDGAVADDDSYADSISADGRHVVFSSAATDLTGTVRTGHRSDVYVRDRATGRTELLVPSADDSPAARSTNGQISDDGRHVVFSSNRKDLVPGGDSTDYLYVRDRREGTTVRIGGPLAWGRYTSPVISADGRRVGFKSNGVPTGPSGTEGRPGLRRPSPDRQFYVYDIGSRRIRLAAWGLGGEDLRADRISLSPDGRHALFSCTSPRVVENDTNEKADVFGTDLVTDNVRLLSLRADGTQADGSSATGAYMSADNRKVYFASRATDLVPGDTNGVDDVFVRNLVTGAVDRVSIGADGTQRTDHARLLGVDRAGDTVLFGSSPDQATPGGPAAVAHLFVRHLN